MSTAEAPAVGKTTGLLAECVARARRGEHVVFLCPHEFFPRTYALPLLEKVILAGTKDWRSFDSSAEVRFNSRGSISLCDPSKKSRERVCGLRFSMVIDHATGDADPSWGLKSKEWLDSTTVLSPVNRGNRFEVVRPDSTPVPPMPMASDSLSIDPMLRDRVIKSDAKEATANQGARMQEFKPGDVVTLKSGGPKMTVRNNVPVSKRGDVVTSAVEVQSLAATMAIANPVTCDWFAGDDPREGTFAAEGLAPA